MRVIVLALVTVVVWGCGDRRERLCVHALEQSNRTELPALFHGSMEIVLGREVEHPRSNELYCDYERPPVIDTVEILEGDDHIGWERRDGKVFLLTKKPGVGRIQLTSVDGDAASFPVSVKPFQETSIFWADQHASPKEWVLLAGSDTMVTFHCENNPPLFGVPDVEQDVWTTTALRLSLTSERTMLHITDTPGTYEVKLPGTMPLYETYRVVDAQDIHDLKLCVGTSCISSGEAIPGDWYSRYSDAWSLDVHVVFVLENGAHVFGLPKEGLNVTMPDGWVKGSTLVTDSPRRLSFETTSRQDATLRVQALGFDASFVLRGSDLVD